MLCKDCGKSMIGSVPPILIDTGRCSKCLGAYLEKQHVKSAEKDAIKKTQEALVQEVEEKKAEEEKIDNRFDILDI